MGQKINPISTRTWIYPARRDGAWFSGYSYSELTVQHIGLQHYIETILFQNQMSVGRFLVTIYPRRIHLILVYRKLTKFFSLAQPSLSTQDLILKQQEKNLVSVPFQPKNSNPSTYRSFVSELEQKSGHLFTQSAYFLFHFGLSTTATYLNYLQKQKGKENDKVTETWNGKGSAFDYRSRELFTSSYDLSLLSAGQKMTLSGARNYVPVDLVPRTTNVPVGHISHTSLSRQTSWKKVILLRKNLQHLIQAPSDNENRPIFRKTFKDLQIHGVFNTSSSHSSLKVELGKKFSFNLVEASKLKGFETSLTKFKWFCNQNFGTYDLTWLYMRTPLSSAEFLAGQIVECLENRESFRKISRHVVQAIQRSPHIVGVRLICSGRFQGAEMARREVRKYGQTSTHDLTSRVDYANRFARTTYGLFGVQVWLCFRSPTEIFG